MTLSGARLNSSPGARLEEVHLVLLPGMDGTGVLFRPLLEALRSTESATVVSYPPDEPLGYDELIGIIRSALPTGRPFLIVAESFSGPLALKLAAQGGTDLVGLVLCASFVSTPTPLPSWLLHAASRLMVSSAPARLQALLLLGRFATPELRALLAEALRPVKPAVLAHRLRAVANVDVRAEFRACPCPVAYVHGRRDLLVSRRHLRVLQSTRPQLRFVSLDAPHLVAQVAPEQVLTVARALWSARKASGTGAER